MKLTVIGGSQGTGADVAELARRAGHEVTVVSRCGRAPAGAHVVTGSAADPEVARRAVDGSWCSPPRVPVTPGVSCRCRYGY